MASGMQNKAYQHFSLLVKANNVQSAQVFFLSTAAMSGWTIPSGVLIYDTTLNKLKFGVGSTTPETITSA